MSNVIYANTDDNSICIGITEYQQAVTPSATMILLSSFDTSVMSQRWTGTAWETLPETDASAREWRDNELATTDWIMPVTDHPDHAAYVTYREELRQWPSTIDFPATKPTLGS
jgi:hypothetical protein